MPKVGQPPIHLWQPELSGVIDIRIDASGDWYHEGGLIKRESLRNLFASILRYEADLGFVLVTPVEKWRIHVEDVPFIAVALQQREADIYFAINIGLEIKLDAKHPLSMRDYDGTKVPYVQVRNGVLARLSRPAYYELVDLAESKNGSLGIISDNVFFTLEPSE